MKVHMTFRMMICVALRNAHPHLQHGLQLILGEPRGQSSADAVHEGREQALGPVLRVRNIITQPHTSMCNIMHQQVQHHAYRYATS